MNSSKASRRSQLLEEFAETREPEIRDQIVESFLPLAEYFAKKYRNSGAELDDLSQVARLGLVKAADRYDIDRGVKFSTYAGQTIDGELKRYFRDKTWATKIPRSLKEKSVEVRGAVDKLSVALKRNPNVNDLAKATGYNHDEVTEALEARTFGYKAKSIDSPTGVKDDTPASESLPCKKNQFEVADAQLTIEPLLQDLPEREREIIELRFFGQLTQKQISDKVGISQMHVSRLIEKTLDKLNSKINHS